MGSLPPPERSGSENCLLWYCTTNPKGFNRFLQDFFRVLQNSGGAGGPLGSPDEKGIYFPNYFEK